MDVSSVTAITAAPAQSAAAPVTIDAIFGALLQSVTEAENTALAAPSIQSAALALVLPASTVTGQQASGQQDYSTDLQTPWLFAPVAQAATPNPLAGFPVPTPNQQSVVALPQATDAPVQTDATAEDIVSPVVAAPITERASSVQPPASQEATPAVPRQVTAAQSGLQPPVEPPATPAPEPVQVPVQTAPQTASSQAASSQTTPQAPTPPNGAVVDQIVTPAPRDPAPVAVKPTAPKAKITAEQPTETAKRDDTTNANAIVDVLAGFLLPQIEQIAAPANDTTVDTADPVTSTKNGDQATPVVATADQNTAAPAQPMPVVMMQPPPVPVAASAQTDQQIAPATVAQTPTMKSDTSADEPTTPAVAEKPVTRQQASAHSQPIFVPANDTAPDSKPEPQATADTRTAPVTDTPQPAQASSTPNPALHQPPIANPAVQPTAPSGLRQLTAGLQVAMQEQETSSSIDKLGLTIATKSIDGLRHFDIRLDPPELGRVQVQLTTDDAGRSQANVVVDKPQTLELLQRDAQSLNRALNEAGLDVSNNGLNFSLREQHRQNDGGEDQGRGRSLSAQAVVQTDATQIHSSLGSYAPNSVRLDIRV